MPPSSPPLLRVTWRSTTITHPLTPQLTLSDLKHYLHTKTNVPPSRQRLLFPHSKPTSDSQLITSLFRSAIPRPILLLGTPDDQLPTPSTTDPQVIDDLHELTQPAKPPTPPPSPPSPPAILPSFSVPSPPPSAPAPPVENHSATNGATLSLEAFDRLLTPALLGPAFLAAHQVHGDNAPLWSHHMSDGLRQAISASRNNLRMLVVAMFDFSIPASGELLRVMQGADAVRAILDSHFAVLTADIGVLEERGGELLRRLGLHSAPAIVVIGEVGGSVSVIDMFNTAFFDDADAIGARLEEVVVGFDGFYEVARVRRSLTEEREGVLREQDEALELARRRDREREREEQEERERVEREEKERERERERREREMERRERDVEEAKKSLPLEPEHGGAKVLVRLPDGRRVVRTFDETARVEDVFNLVVAEGVERGCFELRCTFPRRVWTVEDAHVSVREAEFFPSVTLNVERP